MKNIFVSISKTALMIGATLQLGHSAEDTSLNSLNAEVTEDLPPELQSLNTLFTEKLPEDLQKEIISFCFFPGELNNAALVSKEWHKMSNEVTFHLRPTHQYNCFDPEYLTISTGIANLFPHLTSLDLSAYDPTTNQGSRTPVFSASLLVQLPKLTHLNLCCNSAGSGGVTIHSYGPYINFLTQLTSLDLSYNCLIKDENISNLTNLTELNLCRNTRITTNGLVNLTNLTSLDISRNELIKYDMVGHLI